jgi:hypothetical protein
MKFKDRYLKSARQQRQTRGLKMSERKMISRSVVFGIGIICIILVVGLEIGRAHV